MNSDNKADSLTGLRKQRRGRIDSIQRLAVPGRETLTLEMKQNAHAIAWTLARFVLSRVLSYLLPGFQDVMRINGKRLVVPIRFERGHLHRVCIGI